MKFEMTESHFLSYITTDIAPRVLFQLYQLYKLKSFSIYPAGNNNNFHVIAIFNSKAINTVYHDEIRKGGDRPTTNGGDPPHAHL